jgi:hypothetical protein
MASMREDVRIQGFWLLVVHNGAWAGSEWISEMMERQSVTTSFIHSAWDGADLLA